MTQQTDDDLDATIRDLMKRAGSDAPPSPEWAYLHDVERDRTSRSRWLPLTAAALVVATMIAIAIVLPQRDAPAPRPAVDDGSAATSELVDHATLGAPTTSTTISANPPVVTNPAITTGLEQHLHLPNDWHITDARWETIDSPGISTTTQTWGQLDGSGPSLSWAITIVVLPARDQPDSPRQWTSDIGAAVRGDWTSDGFRYLIEADGVDQPSVAAFVQGLNQRDATNPMAGSDDPTETGTLVYETTGDGRSVPSETWLHIEVANTNGTTAELTVFDRHGNAPVTLGPPIHRILLGDRVAVGTPTAAWWQQLAWNGQDIQYRVVASNAQVDVLPVAQAMNAIDDSTWKELLAHEK